MAGRKSRSKYDVADHVCAKEVDQHIRMCKVFVLQRSNRLANNHFPGFPALSYDAYKLAEALYFCVPHPVF